MYTIIGTDGQQYGPVTAEQLKQWMAEGRVNRQTMIKVEGATNWQALETLPLCAMTTSQQVPAVKTHGFAITGLVLGILSVCQCCGGIPAIAGIVFSWLAITQINKSPTAYNGKSMAVAGLITSIVGLALTVVILLVYGTFIMAALFSEGKFK
jgi:hypothetical protein